MALVRLLGNSGIQIIRFKTEKQIVTLFKSLKEAAKMADGLLFNPGISSPYHSTLLVPCAPRGVTRTKQTKHQDAFRIKIRRLPGNNVKMNAPSLVTSQEAVHILEDIHNVQPARQPIFHSPTISENPSLRLHCSHMIGPRRHLTRSTASPALNNRRQ